MAKKQITRDCPTCGTETLTLWWERTTTGKRPGVRCWPTSEAASHLQVCQTTGTPPEEDPDPDPEGN